MDNYVCTICGHTYDPSVGEPVQDIPAGIAFEQLPAGWECPICGAAKTLFQKA